MRLPCLATIVVAMLTFDDAHSAYAQWTPETNCVSYVSATRRKEKILPFEIIGVGRFPMPHVTECDGWTIEDGMLCSGGLSDVYEESAVHIERSRDGIGCDLVVDEYLLVIEPLEIDDPRLHDVRHLLEDAEE